MRVAKWSTHAARIPYRRAARRAAAAGAGARLGVVGLEGVDLLDEVAVTRALGRIPEHRLARSMVDTACWDLRAQAAGMPLWQLWGGDPEVPLSWTVTRQAPAAMARESAEMVERHGFQTLKLKG